MGGGGWGVLPFSIIPLPPPMAILPSPDMIDAMSMSSIMLPELTVALSDLPETDGGPP